MSDDTGRRLRTKTPLFKEGFLKSLMLLWNMLAQECAGRCCTSATRDLETVARRIKHEGLSFFTITLPNYGKDFESCLDRGMLTPTSFPGFRRTWDPDGGQGLPAFLRGFLELVFDLDSGVLLDEPNVDAIRSIRQLTLVFGKILVPCSDARVRAAKRGYVECEQDVRISDAALSQEDYWDFERMSLLLFGKLFAELDDVVWVRDDVFPHMVRVQPPIN